MGGHAFRELHCPRISPELYFKAREQTKAALRRLFTHVVVPNGMPEKADFGDVDFLVSGFIPNNSATPLNWEDMVSAIKEGFATSVGGRGRLNPSVMYFAVPARNFGGDDFHIQVDVKVCDTAGLQQFEWSRFQLNYASGSKMLGSLLKPLGLTINPEGLYIRVEEMEETNFHGSTVFVSQNSKDVLKIVGLDWRILWGAFQTRDEIYEYFASSWVFNPAHFAERLKDPKYIDHLEDRSVPWVHFVKEWIPERYPNYRLPSDAESDGSNCDIEKWYKDTRALIRGKVFTLFPDVTIEYYTKRMAHLKEVEEQRIRELLMRAIPDCEKTWSNSFHRPRIVIESVAPLTPPPSPTQGGNYASIRSRGTPSPIQTNYVGMWRNRFEKQDAKAAKARERQIGVEKILKRLRTMNAVVGAI
ncbi:hypothetical protein CC80DRAFT_398811 [Byssothecium circinans]|uniref:Uncharacterized protein n=1 Tax=Byssothecium circinans TaxID=147558 RepID=A0A6A5UCC4_9PLEO|nr:hypothetical protein CC80DRAFT_398811 [Byssothecium circinans]